MLYKNATPRKKPLVGLDSTILRTSPVLCPSCCIVLHWLYVFLLSSRNLSRRSLRKMRESWQRWLRKRHLPNPGRGPQCAGPETPRRSRSCSGHEARGQLETLQACAHRMRRSKVSARLQASSPMSTTPRTRPRSSSTRTNSAPRPFGPGGVAWL